MKTKSILSIAAMNLIALSVLAQSAKAQIVLAANGSLGLVHSVNGGPAPCENAILSSDQLKEQLEELENKVGSSCYVASIQRKNSDYIAAIAFECDAQTTEYDYSAIVSGAPECQVRSVMPDIVVPPGAIIDPTLSQAKSGDSPSVNTQTQKSGASSLPCVDPSSFTRGASAD